MRKKKLLFVQIIDIGMIKYCAKKVYVVFAFLCVGKSQWAQSQISKYVRLANLSFQRGLYSCSLIS